MRERIDSAGIQRGFRGKNDFVMQLLGELYQCQCRCVESRQEYGRGELYAKGHQGDQQEQTHLHKTNRLETSP